MKRWLYAAAGLLAVFAFWILGGPERKVRKLTRQRDDLILDGSGRSKAKAHLAGIKADKHQLNAVVAADAGRKVMDRVGTNNESMSNLLDSWRKPVSGV